MKQNIKNKLIKWGFKYLHRWDSQTGQVYQLESYQGRKQKRELNLGSSVVLDLCQVLKDAYCHVFFDNFFNSPTLIQKLHDNGLYGLGTARSNRINMSQMKKNNEIKWGDYQWKFYNHITCIKWYGNKSMMIIRSHLEEIISTSTVQRRLKGSLSKIPVNCPSDITLCNSQMGGLELMDQLKSAYQLDRRLKFQFYLSLFFDLFDVALADSFIVFKKLENKDLTLKEFKVCIALKLIVSFISRRLSCPNHRPSKRTKAQRPSLISPSHFLQFSWRQDDDVLHDPKQEKKTEYFLPVHYVM